MSVGVTGIKPKKPYQEFGPDVTITNDKADKDPHASLLLTDAGKSMTPTGMSYMGSVACHWYVSKTNLVGVSNEIITKHQFCIGDMNEQVAILGISNLTRSMRVDNFGHRLGTTDQKDKR